MADQQGNGEPGERLPARIGNRLPAVVPPAAVAPTVPGALVRAALGGPAAAAGALVRATASVMTGAVAHMVRPWLVGIPVTPPPTREWSGPGVHVSYTHIEVHWSTR